MYYKNNRNIPVLFCTSDSVYKKLGCDVWDEKRDALTWMGKQPGIYHPPCQLWCRMRYFSTRPEFEKYYALWAVNKVRSYGGILEHPKASRLFKVMNLPKPGFYDEFGFTIEIDQFNYGHKARKSTWLYICGLQLNDVKHLLSKKIPGKCKYVCSTSKRGIKPELSQNERNKTPLQMAKLFVKIIHKINNYNNLKK
jgi:hypothetical protein